MDFVYLNEIIGRSEFGQVAVGTATMQDSIMLHLYASADQRERYLAPLVAGGRFPSVGLTEPEVAGSDPTQMQTTAYLDGDEWVINGHKWFTSGASRAAFTTVFAKTEPDAEKHVQFSSIIVPTDTPGYLIQRAVPTMGHVGGQHCEVVLDNVRVPTTNLLGNRGEGFLISQKRLGPGRIFHCMRWLGQAQRAFELMCERALERYAHGSLLAEKGAIQTMIAQSAAEIQGARLMTLDAARVIDSGADARVAISLIKFHGATMLHNVIDRAIQVHGALGVTSDRPLDKMYREARYAGSTTGLTRSTTWSWPATCSATTRTPRPGPDNRPTCRAVRHCRPVLASAGAIRPLPWCCRADGILSPWQGDGRSRGFRPTMKMAAERAVRRTGLFVQRFGCRWRQDRCARWAVDHRDSDHRRV